MPWNGGYKGADAGLVSNMTFMGSEPGGWLRYQIDTGLNVDMSANVPGIYGARLFVGGIGAEGSSLPGAGNYMCDFEYTAEVVPSTPFFVNGAAANYGTDPLGRPPGTSRLRLIVRLRPVNVPFTVSSIAVTTLFWQIFRVT